MKHYYVESPCNHGKLVDVIPHDGWSDALPAERVGLRWGLMTVVLRSDASADRQEPRKPVPCCSHQEGEFATEAEAMAACEHQKKHSHDQVGQALAVLEGVTQQIWSLARVNLTDLVRLREKLAGMGRLCSVPLCFEEGMTHWLVDEEAERCLCPQHVAGKKIENWKGEEVTLP